MYGPHALDQKGGRCKKVIREFKKTTTAKFRRRTSHEPNRMLMRENKGLFLFAFDSAHVKHGV